MSSPSRIPTASERLAARKDKVLRTWQARVREEIPEASGAPEPILIDTLPTFLDHLAQALSPQHPRASAAHGSTVPQEHGSERVRQTRFKLADLIREYQLLRDVLFEVLGAGAPLSSAEQRVIVSSIDAAARDSCTAYALASEEFRERIILTMAHDLRGPLSAAKAGAALVLRRPADPAVPRWAARIEENIDRVDHMLRTLLDVSRAGSGARLKLDLVQCDLVALVHEVVERLRLTHGDRFEVDAPQELHGTWSGDALARAVENLLSNALKYGDRQRPVTLSLRESHERAILAVHNDGSFIPPEEREDLFEAFRRSRGAEASGVGGWGLGLPLVRAVAEGHGGSVSVESLAGTGTTFTMDIPRDSRPFQGSSPESTGATAESTGATAQPQ
jgi:signal transduction histidine kinase